MKKLFIIIVCLATFVFQKALAQSKTVDSTYKRHSLGSSLFVLANLFPNPPSFYQLNYAHRLTPKDVVSLEAITWTYSAPLGIPYGPSYEAEKENYPGHVRGVGLGVAYQRFLWKNFYTALHANSLRQTYRDLNKQKIQNGFQLFCTFRAGYHWAFFKNRFFIEPSVAATFWPINTNLPPTFRAKEKKWPNYFLFEPGLHFGIKF